MYNFLLHILIILDAVTSLYAILDGNFHFLFVRIEWTYPYCNRPPFRISLAYTESCFSGSSQAFVFRLSSFFLWFTASSALDLKPSSIFLLCLQHTIGPFPSSFTLEISRTCSRWCKKTLCANRIYICTRASKTKYRPHHWILTDCEEQVSHIIPEKSFHMFAAECSQTFDDQLC